MPDAPPSRIKDTDTSAHSRASSSRTKKDGARALTRNQLQEKIAEQITMAGTLVGMGGDTVGAFILLSQADAFGDAWADVAAVNPRVKRILERWFQDSVYMGAATATIGIALPLATHYRIIPSARLNPAAKSVADMETLVANGTTLDELLQQYADAQEAQAKIRDMMREAVNNQNASDDADGDAPDHFEAPTNGANQ